jgi:DNA-directed RNA polymerase specialized sigma24 family protein
MTEPTTSLRPTDFEPFYLRTWDDVYRTLALVTGNLDIAREATDEAMARALQRWDRVSSYENPEGWVYTVALNWARSQLRRRRTGVSGEVAVWDPMPNDPTLMRAIERLPRAQREVVVLKFVHDWSERQIADTLGVRPGTVKSRLHRALATLREDLS